jgi:GH24 family phage-related lysozyme (muramidase)
MSYLDDAVGQLKVFEGSIPWLYRDTRGNVTVGVGTMIPSLAACVTLNQSHPLHCENAPATMAQIMADWNRLQHLPFGQEYAAGGYKALMSVYLLEADITALLMEIVTQCDTNLRRDYPDYDSLPDGVKLALIDMDYNLGDAKLRGSYPRFDAAVDVKDYTTMAAQCHRAGIPDARNEWTKNLLLAAASGT